MLGDSKTSQATHCGVARRNVANASQVQRCESTTAVAEAVATNRNAVVAAPSSAPTSTGDATAPRMPRPAMPSASQRIARIVAAVATPNASASPAAAGISS